MRVIASLPEVKSRYSADRDSRIATLIGDNSEGRFSVKEAHPARRCAHAISISSHYHIPLHVIARLRAVGSAPLSVPAGSYRSGDLRRSSSKIRRHLRGNPMKKVEAALLAMGYLSARRAPSGTAIPL